MKTQTITLTHLPGILLVVLPDGSEFARIEGSFFKAERTSNDYSTSLVRLELPQGNWRIVSTLAELCNCFVCGGDGKETCNNPDHGFLDAIGGVVGANESSCPVCGHDPNHKVKNGGDCECCNGLGFLTTNQFIDACEEYGYDDSPMPPESFHSAIRASGWYLENPYSDPELTMMQGNGFVYYGADDEDFEIYEQAQSRTLDPELTLILEKI